MANKEDTKFEAFDRTPVSSQATEFNKIEELDEFPFMVDFGTPTARTGANQVTGRIINRPSRAIGVSSRKFLKLHPDFLVSGVLECDATVVTVAGDAGATTLKTYTIGANQISRNNSVTELAGNTFRIHTAGTYTTDDGSATVAIALKVGSTTYHTITTTAASVTDAPWCIDWVIIVSAIGASGTAESYASAKTNNVNKDSGSTGTQTIDTTASQAISLTATWSSGSSGDNIKIRQFMVELLN